MKGKLKVVVTCNSRPLAKNKINVSGNAVMFTAEPRKFYRVTMSVSR